MKTTKEVDLDDVFVNICPAGKYHRWLFIWTLLYCLCNILNTNYEFVAKEESFSCADPEFHDHLCDANITHKCTKFVYDNPDSFVAVYELGCSDWKLSLVKVAFFCGQLVCLLLVGPLSDRFGRKPVIVATVVWGGIFTLAKSFSPTFWMYIALEFLGAAFGDGLMPLLTLCMELVATEHRVFFTSIVFTGPPSGGILLPLMAWFFPDFKVFLRVISVPAILCISYYYAIDESPRWLVNRGRVNEAVAIVEHISEVNHVAVDVTPMYDYQNDPNENTSYLSTMRLVCTTKAMLIRLLLCSIMCLTHMYSRFGLIDDFEQMEGSKYVTYALLASIDIPCSLVGGFLMNGQRRKINYIAVLLPAALVCWIHPFLTHDKRLSVVIYLLGRIADSFLFLFNIIIIAEMFPTKIRVTVLGFCHAISSIGYVAAQQTALLAKYWFALPQMFFGLSMLLAFLTILLLPETYKSSLPESVEEAKALGTKHGFKALFQPKRKSKDHQEFCSQVYQNCR